MHNNTTKKIVLNGLMIALVFLATFITKINTPLPGGYFNLGDSMIMTAAIVLGRNTGLISGALGSCLADIASGSFLFAPFTLAVKGLEGYLTGILASSALSPRTSASARNVIAVIAGAVVMVAGYFVSEAFFLTYFSKGFGLAAAVSEFPANLVQGGLGAIAGYIISALLLKLNIKSRVA